MSENKALKEEIKKAHVFLKQYSFVKGSVRLPFTLNIRDQEELRTFVDLMEEAIVEVKEDINNLDK